MAARLATRLSLQGAAFAVEDLSELVPVVSVIQLRYLLPYAGQSIQTIIVMDPAIKALILRALTAKSRRELVTLLKVLIERLG